MPDTEQIKPALTKEQWALVRDGKGFFATTGLIDEAVRFTEASDLSMLIATANAALPDDDPRKIARADVEALQSILDTSDLKGAPEEDQLTALCAKLAALLPPEHQ